ncbi:hypothetical protein ACFZDJ_13640 [Streptomyces sp. NPDC007896]|uniref:hypothetical protein n=1 Tax=Streptomyces sp. NPDC007896 TaxID=3364784 RepID=UPI0036F16DD5
MDEDDTFQLTATVPAGTRAEILLPDGTTAQRGPGIHHFTAGHALGTGGPGTRFDE